MVILASDHPIFPRAEAAIALKGAATLPPENVLVRPEVRGLLEPDCAWPQLTTVEDFKQLGLAGFGVAKFEFRCNFTGS